MAETKLLGLNLCVFISGLLGHRCLNGAMRLLGKENKLRLAKTVIFVCVCVLREKSELIGCIFLNICKA